MNKFWVITGCILLAISVSVGAFGAHGLKNILEANDRLDTFETAVKYQFYHAFAILILGLIGQQFTISSTNLIGYLFLSGIFIFSGSLYVLSLTGIRWLGAITPFGGVAFIAGWLLMAYKIYRSS